MDTAKADRFNKLKARVKAEMLRRKYNGSVSSYGGSSYDYTVKPADGTIIKSEHRDKLITPMRAINSNSIPEANGNILKDSELSNLESKLSVWETRSATSSTSDCRSSCTGLCVTACSTGCTGCSGTCSGKCTNSCSGCGGCDNTCSTACGNGCGTGCGAACSFSCGIGGEHTCSGPPT